MILSVPRFFPILKPIKSKWKEADLPYQKKVCNGKGGFQLNIFNKAMENTTVHFEFLSVCRYCSLQGHKI